MSIRYNILHYSKIIGLILLVILIKLSFKKKNNEEFYPNGQKISSGIFIDGKAESAWTWWYQNGNKMTEGIFINGKRNGTWSTWYKNSQKKSQALYIDDKLNGSYTSWHENGEVKYKGKYKDDKLDSIQFYYDTLGRLIGKKQFKAGILLDKPYEFQ